MDSPTGPWLAAPPAGFHSPIPRKFSEILEKARQLPYGGRAELIEQLVAAAAKGIDPASENAWGDEVLRRLKREKSTDELL